MSLLSLIEKSPRKNGDAPKAKYPIVIEYAKDDGKVYKDTCVQVGFAGEVSASELGRRIIALAIRGLQAESQE